MTDVRRRLPGTDLDFWSLAAAERAGLGDLGRLPMTVKVLLEMVLRQNASEVSVRALAGWPAPPAPEAEVAKARALCCSQGPEVQVGAGQTAAHVSHG
jgi:hypothetical protein